MQLPAAFQLRNIDLSVKEGECHAVLGPSGSGKSTLLNAVLGMLPPQGGSVRLAGVDITRQPIERRGLGYLPQQIGLFPHLTVLGNITYSARARGLSPSRFQPLLDRLVEATGIGEFAWRDSLIRYPAVSGSASLLSAPWPVSRDWCCWMNPSLH